MFCAVVAAALVSRAVGPAHAPVQQPHTRAVLVWMYDCSEATVHKPHSDSFAQCHLLSTPSGGMLLAMRF